MATVSSIFTSAERKKPSPIISFPLAAHSMLALASLLVAA